MPRGDYSDFYKQLEGFRIMKFMGYNDMGYDFYEGDEFPEFLLRNPRTGEEVVIAISRDPEGNGGGHLFIEDVKEKL